MFMRDLKKVSALWSVRFRVSALERFYYKGFLRNSSGTKIFVSLREVSALEDVRLREVPLYFKICQTSFCIQITGVCSKDVPYFKISAAETNMITVNLLVESKQDLNLKFQFFGDQ